MSLSLIVAMDPNGVIGKNNKLPWPHIKEDMKFFRQKTLNHVVIMGRKTWQSIHKALGKPLPKRTNFIITRQKDLTIDGCYVFNSFQKAVEEAEKIDPQPIVIGGSAVYQMALPLVRTMHITKIKQEYEGDTYFPQFDSNKWKEEIIQVTPIAIYTKLLRASGL